MGARDFVNVTQAPNIGRAFWTEVANAIRTYGNDGYTGTIAEKYEYVLLPVPPTVLAAQIVRWALAYDLPESGELLADMPEVAAAVVAEAAELVRDKWGPAVAVELTPQEVEAQTRDDSCEQMWIFFGSASW